MELMADRFRWVCIKTYFAIDDAFGVLDRAADRTILAFYLWRGRR